MSYKLSTGLLLLIAGAAQAGPLYTLSKSVPIGAPDRWDLLTFDPESHRVYIAHGDRVTVVDVPAGKVVGNVEGLPGGTHGVAVIASLHRGYTDDGKAGTANSFDLGVLKVLKAIPAADDADAIAFDRVSGNLFVIDSDPGKITVIDPRTDTVRATLDGGGKLEIGVADGLGKLFVNGEAKREILRIDTRTLNIDARWPIPDCESPHGIAVDPRSHHVFSSCANQLMVVVSTQDGSLLAKLPIGAHTDGLRPELTSRLQLEWRRNADRDRRTQAGSIRCARHRADRAWSTHHDHRPEERRPVRRRRGPERERRGRSERLSASLHGDTGLGQAAGLPSDKLSPCCCAMR